MRISFDISKVFFFFFHSAFNGFSCKIRCYSFTCPTRRSSQATCQTFICLRPTNHTRCVPGHFIFSLSTNHAVRRIVKMTFEIFARAMHTAIFMPHTHTHIFRLKIMINAGTLPSLIQLFEMAFLAPNLLHCARPLHQSMFFIFFYYYYLFWAVWWGGYLLQHHDHNIRMVF